MTNRNAAEKHRDEALNYRTELAYELRHRGCEESTVADILRGIDAVTAASGPTPLDDFGTPREYAAQFSGPRKPTPGRQALGVCVILGLAVMLFGNNLPFFPLVPLVPAVLIGLFFGNYLDTRLPTDYTPLTTPAADQRAAGSTRAS